MAFRNEATARVNGGSFVAENCALYKVARFALSTETERFVADELVCWKTVVQFDYLLS